MVEVALKDPRRGMTKVVVCNCHMHYMTAKNANTILEHKVRILAGDFNMSLWAVARQMRGCVCRSASPMHMRGTM